MSSLAPLTALGQPEPTSITVGDFTLREITDCALASVAARNGKIDGCTKLIAQVTGAHAPEPGRASSGEISAFWMSPEHWMVVAPYTSHEHLADELVNKANGAASITEQSDGWCRFDLTGTNLSGPFSLLCSLDFPTFKGGEASRTQIEHLGCLVVCHSPEHASVYGPRSSAGSLYHALHCALLSVR